MPRYYAGLDVADATTAVCIVDESGAVVATDSVPTSVRAIADALRPYKRSLKLVGQENGRLASELQSGLSRQKFAIVPLDAAKAHALLKMTLNKTDANDARGLAVLMAKGLYAKAHVKSPDAARLRAVLGMRRQIVLSLASLKVAYAKLKQSLDQHAYPKRRRVSLPMSELEKGVASTAKSYELILALMEVERKKLDASIKDIAGDIPMCRRFMAIPGVGPICALTFFATVDDPARFANSRTVPVFLGLTPRVFQSGTSSRSGGISHRGDVHARTALYASAKSLLTTSNSTWRVKSWGQRIASKKGNKIATVAVARKLAVIMHHIWITDLPFDPDHRSAKAAAAIAQSDAPPKRRQKSDKPIANTKARNASATKKPAAKVPSRDHLKKSQTKAPAKTLAKPRIAKTITSKSASSPASTTGRVVRKPTSSRRKSVKPQLEDRP